MSISLYEEHETSPGGGSSKQPGVLYKVPFDDYRALEGINNSSLHDMAKSPAHWQHAQENPREYNSPALTFGTLAHVAVLEPEALLERYVVMPDFEAELQGEYAKPKLSKAYREKVADFQKMSRGMEIVSKEDMTRALGVQRSVQQYANVFHSGRAEVVLRWQDEATGLWCKARPDYMRFGDDWGTIYDFKTTRDCTKFGRSIAEFCYDRQAAFYLRGARANGLDVQTFHFVCCETEPPYQVMSAPLDAETLADGDAQVDFLLGRVAECTRTGHFPVADSPDAFRKPAWAMRFRKDNDIEIT